MLTEGSKPLRWEFQAYLAAGLREKETEDDGGCAEQFAEGRGVEFGLQRVAFSHAELWRFCMPEVISAKVRK